MFVCVTTAYQRKVQEFLARLNRTAGQGGAEASNPRSEVDRLRRMLRGSPRRAVSIDGAIPPSRRPLKRPSVSPSRCRRF